MKSYISAAVIMSLLSAFSISAAPITPQQALLRINENKSSSRMKAPAKGNYSLAYTLTEENAEKTPLVYIFDSSSDGFIITPADNSFPEILGWSDTGSFDYNKAPENFKWWINGYKSEISAALKDAESRGETLPEYNGENETASWSPISPMVTTKWNQDAPYNNLCPQKNGKNSVTGCVATAMAQVINYHKYPVKGIGTHSYQWENQTLEFNYGETTFDWNNMLDVYSDNNFNETQANAVATLMLACGISVDMGYSPESSGAYSERVPGALIDNFNFAPTSILLSREYFDDDQWQNMVYAELAAGRPIYYAGNDGSAGHAFVCDGNRGDNFFHINWGWGGMSDGYYRLESLLPNSQGIGGGSGQAGFSRNQRAGIGIQKPEDAKVMTPWILAQGNFSITETDGKLTCTFGNGFFNFSNFDATAVPGLKITATDGSAKYIEGVEEYSFPKTNASGALGYTGFEAEFNAEGYEPGRYIVTPVVKCNGEWNDIYIQNGYVKSSMLVVSLDNTHKFVTPPASGLPDLKVKINSTKTTNVSNRVLFQFNITCENNSGTTYDGNMSLLLMSRYTGKIEGKQEFNVKVEPGTPLSNTIRLYWEKGKFGIYDCIITDEYGVVISDKAEIVYGTPVTSISIEDLTLKGVGETGFIEAAILPENASLKSLEWSSENPEVAVVDNSGNVTAKGEGITEITALATDGSGVSGKCTVTVGNQTAIFEIFDENAVITAVYNVNGTMILSNVTRNELRDLPKGIYIVKTGTKTIKWLNK